MLAHPGHAFLKRRALCSGDLRSSPAARPGCGLAWHRRLQELCKAATPAQQHPKWVQLGAEHCGDGPRCRVSAAVLGALVALLPGPHRRRRCSSLVPPPPRSNRQSWRCGQRHLRRSGLPQTWALAPARAPAGEGAGPSCPKATARPRLTGRGQLRERSGRLSLPLLPAPAGAPTGERAWRGPSPRRRRRKLGSVVVGASRPSRAARPAGQPAACGGQERGGRAAGGELRRRLPERSGSLPRAHGRTCWPRERPGVPPARGPSRRRVPAPAGASRGSYGGVGGAGPLAMRP